MIFIKHNNLGDTKENNIQSRALFPTNQNLDQATEANQIYNNPMNDNLSYHNIDQLIRYIRNRIL